MPSSLPRPAARWRFVRLLDAPHRLAFAAGTLMLAVIGLWWAALQLGPAPALRSGLPLASVHGLLMTFGFMPLFFAGFLFTAGPRWLGLPPLAARPLQAPVVAQLAGWGVFLLSVHGRDADFGRCLGALGLTAVLIGWGGITVRFVSLLRASRVADRLHARCIAAGCGIGVLALAGAIAGLALGEFVWLRVATQVALWGFIGLVFVTVAHRMIPFFSAAAVPALEAWRPNALQRVFAAVCGAQALGAAAEALAGGPATPPAPALLALRAAIELAGGTGALLLALRWGLVQSLRIRLLAMLHLGFCWLGIALLLAGISHAIAASGGAPGVFGLAPLHAFTIGFLGSTLLAMVTRVSCGHGGRTLVADDLVWRLFWVLQLAAITRLAAAFAREVSASWSGALVAAAAVGWAGVCLAWALRHGRWYGMPRLDGRPG